MSGAISGSAGFPALAQLLAGLGQINKSFNTLTDQASSGIISHSFAGLGSAAPVALSLNPQIDNLRVSRSNIEAASGPAQLTQTAMKQIQTIASNLLSALPNLNGLNPSQIDVIAANARSDLAEVGQLLNSQYAGVYVFAGEDSRNPPVPNPDQITTSGFYTQISAQVVNISSSGAASAIAATLAISGSNGAGTSPFSTYMSQPAGGMALPTVSTGMGRSQKLGLLASANIGVTSTGASTTGSYMRDLMRALATVGSLTSSQATDPNFAVLVGDTQTSVIGSIAAMSTDVGILGQQQSVLSEAGTILSDTEVALTGQLSLAKDVDMAATLSNLTLTQTQLQQSYRLIAMVSGMSLAKFLS
jgi:flagellar hook-associated protein 3 FlgL